MNTLEIAAKLLADSEKERHIANFPYFQRTCGVPEISVVWNRDFFYINLFDDFHIINQIGFYYLKNEFIGYGIIDLRLTDFKWASKESYYKMKSYLESLSVFTLDLIEVDLSLLYKRTEITGSDYSDKTVLYDEVEVKIIKIYKEGWLEEKNSWTEDYEKTWHSELVLIQFEDKSTMVLKTESLTFKQIL